VIGKKFEDGSIHSLPQDYADMLGWEELTSIAKITDTGAITVIGEKNGLPEAVCFDESFRYWIPRKFDPDITSFIYINGKLGEDIQRLFNKITLIGKISNPDAREYGTAVYLCEYPKTSFNEFWTNRLKDLRDY
jgi:hypothetical protein